jgi:hypothetical protein
MKFRGAPAADTNAAVSLQEIGTSRWQLNHHVSVSYNGRAVGEQEIKARLNQDATIYNLRRKKPYRSLATKARARGDRVGAFDAAS